MTANEVANTLVVLTRCSRGVAAGMTGQTAAQEAIMLSAKTVLDCALDLFHEAKVTVGLRPGESMSSLSKVSHCDFFLHFQIFACLIENGLRLLPFFFFSFFVHLLVVVLKTMLSVLARNNGNIFF